MSEDMKLIIEALKGVSGDAVWIAIAYVFFNYLKVLTVVGVVSFTVLRLVDNNERKKNGINKNYSNTL